MLIDWPEGLLIWRIIGWLILGGLVSTLHYRMIQATIARAAREPERGSSIIMSRYLVRMVLNFGMMLLAYVIDGHPYVLIATLAGLLSTTVLMAVRTLTAKDG